MWHGIIVSVDKAKELLPEDKIELVSLIQQVYRKVHKNEWTDYHNTILLDIENSPNIYKGKYLITLLENKYDIDVYMSQHIDVIFMGININEYCNDKFLSIDELKQIIKDRFKDININPQFYFGNPCFKN